MRSTWNLCESEFEIFLLACDKSDVLSGLGVALVDTIRIWRSVRCPLDVLLFVTILSSGIKASIPFKSDLGLILISQWAQEVVCGARAVSLLEKRCTRKAG